MFLTILLSILMSFAPLQVDANQTCAAQSENVELKQREGLYSHNDFVLIGLTEFGSTDFIIAFENEIEKSNGNIFGTGVSADSFYSGTQLQIDTTGLDIEFMQYSTPTKHFLKYDDVIYLNISYRRGEYNGEPSYPNQYLFEFYLDHWMYPYEVEIYQYYEYVDYYSPDKFVTWSEVHYNGAYTTNKYFLKYLPSEFYGLLPSSFLDPSNQIIANDYYSQGYNVGYNIGYDSGNSNGLATGYNRGYDSGVTDGQYTGYQNGYADGLAEAQTQDTLALQIFSGCVEVGLLPINVMLRMFEYEIFGINVAGFVSALLTIAIVIIVIRVVTGKKDD